MTEAEDIKDFLISNNFFVDYEHGDDFLNKDANKAVGFFNDDGGFDRFFNGGKDESRLVYIRAISYSPLECLQDCEDAADFLDLNTFQTAFHDYVHITVDSRPQIESLDEDRKIYYFNINIIRRKR